MRAAIDVQVIQSRHILSLIYVWPYVDFISIKPDKMDIFLTGLAGLAAHLAEKGRLSESANL